jgi:hypothetical protein
MPTETATVLEPINNAVIELPTKLITRGESLAKQALTLTVTDAASYESAALLGRQLKDEKAARLDFFKPIKRSIDASKQTVLDRERAAIAPIEKAMLHLDGVATAWRREQERIQIERQRAAEAVEAKRIEAERKALAKEALAEGNKRLAKQITAAPIVPQVTVESAVPQVTGVRKRTVWKFRVTNAAKVPREWCQPDEKAIGEFVREHKENAAGKIPGIEVYADEHTI